MPLLEELEQEEVLFTNPTMLLAWYAFSAAQLLTYAPVARYVPI